MSASRQAAISAAIGRELTAVRKSRGWNQVDLAEAAGIAQHTYSRYETGAIAITAVRLVEIARILDVPAAYLLPKEDQF